jgi:hypothetical protein
MPRGIAGYLFRRWQRSRSFPRIYLPSCHGAAGIRVDPLMMVFTAVISLVTGILFGLVPLFGMRRVSAEAIAEAGQSDRRRIHSSHAKRARRGADCDRDRPFSWRRANGEKLLGAHARSAGFPFGENPHRPTVAAAIRYPDNRKIAAFERDTVGHPTRDARAYNPAASRPTLPLSGADNGWAFFIEGRPPLRLGLEHGEIPSVSGGIFRKPSGSRCCKGAGSRPSDTGRLAMGGRDQRCHGPRALGDRESSRPASAFRGTHMAHRV